MFCSEKQEQKDERNLVRKTDQRRRTQKNRINKQKIETCVVLF